MAISYKVLGQANPAATTLTDVYTVPGATEAVVSSIVVTNRGSADTTFRIAVRPAGAGVSDENYIAYDASITANALTSFTLGVTLGAGDVVSVYSGDATLSFNVFGQEVS